MLSALYIAVIGMLLVFACLGVVLLLMMVIGRLFPEKGTGEGSKKG